MHIDLEKTRIKLNRFLKGYLMRSGMKGYVVGLSGGIDSALSISLAVEAVGPDKVLAVLLPYCTSSAESITDAMVLVNQLGVEFLKVDISPMVDAYYDEINDSNRLRVGNKMARERMSILYDISLERGLLVLGTGNRTEISLGYTTLFGDSACALNPLADLYKTEVRDLSKMLSVPDAIISKPPSADLWVGQTDEDEIGVTYEQIDKLLRRIIDEGERSMSRLDQDGFSATDVSRVVSMVNRNYFKRKLPETASLGRAEIPSDIILVE